MLFRSSDEIQDRLCLTFLDYFTAVMRSKIGSALVCHNILLARTKIKGDKVMRLGIVDLAHDRVKSVVKAAVRLRE